MTLGCLTGNGKRQPIEGSYTLCAPGLTTPLLPDLKPEPVEGASHPFHEGALTDGDHATGIGWRAATVCETGVDIVVRFGTRCFIDHVVLHPPSSGGDTPPPTTAKVSADEGIESIGHVEPAGLACVEAYASTGTGNALGMVGGTGRRGSDLIPDGPITVSVGVEAEEIVIRAISCQRDIRLGELQVWGAAAGEPAVFPVPAEMELLPGPGVVLSGAVSVLTGASPSDDTRFAAVLLAEKLSETYGMAVGVTDSSEGADTLILVGKQGECDRLDAEGMEAPEGPEAYALKVTEKYACIVASGRRGLVYGVETLLQLLQTVDGAPTAPACLIKDAPRLEFRGAHLFLPARDQLDYTRRLIRYLLVPMKMNTIFLELAGGMRFDLRPEISEAWEKNNRLADEGKAPKIACHNELCGGGWITKAEVKDLVDYAREYGIEVIPEIQSLSHVQYLNMTYPEIAEQHSGDGFPDSYCPLHPDSHRIVFDMIDEVVDLLGPLRYLHMGHDEVYTMAECPRCKGKSRDELFAYDVNAIYDYLKKKGVGMMIWGDMLQPWQRYSGENAATMIPNDIVLLEFVWYFRPWMDTEDHLLENGFKVIMGNCYSSHFTRYEKRTSKEGVIGAQVSVWAATDEEAMGRLGKLYDMVYSANTAWSSHCQDELRWTFDRMISELMPGIRARLGPDRALPERTGTASITPIDLTDHFTAPRQDNLGRKGAYDLECLPQGRVVVRGVPFLLGDGVILVETDSTRGQCFPPEAVIPIGARAQALLFAHTCSGPLNLPQPFGPRPRVGRYEVSYGDGTTATAEIAYGCQIAEWNRRHGQPLGPTHHRHAGYVGTYPVDALWQGKTPRGEDVTVYGYEWANPHPEKELVSVRILSEDSQTDASLMVAGISIVAPGD